MPNSAQAIRAGARSCRRSKVKLEAIHASSSRPQRRAERRSGAIEIGGAEREARHGAARELGRQVGGHRPVCHRRADQRRVARDLDALAIGGDGRWLARRHRRCDRGERPAVGPRQPQQLGPVRAPAERRQPALPARRDAGLPPPPAPARPGTPGRRRAARARGCPRRTWRRPLAPDRARPGAGSISAPIRSRDSRSQPLLRGGAGGQPVGIEAARRDRRTRHGSGRSAGCAGSPRGCAAPGRRRSAPGRARRSGSAAERIDDVALGRGVERVHGEVAPRGILGEVAREGHGGMAAEGLDVTPEGGDLEGRAVRRPP